MLLCLFKPFWFMYFVIIKKKKRKKEKWLGKVVFIRRCTVSIACRKTKPKKPQWPIRTRENITSNHWEPMSNVRPPSAGKPS